eukprot:102586_1
MDRYAPMLPKKSVRIKEININFDHFRIVKRCPRLLEGYSLHSLDHDIQIKVYGNKVQVLKPIHLLYTSALEFNDKFNDKFEEDQREFVKIFKEINKRNNIE